MGYLNIQENIENLILQPNLNAILTTNVWNSNFFSLIKKQSTLTKIKFRETLKDNFRHVPYTLDGTTRGGNHSKLCPTRLSLSTTTSDV